MIGGPVSNGGPVRHWCRVRGCAAFPPCSDSCARLPSPFFRVVRSRVVSRRVEFVGGVRGGEWFEPMRSLSWWLVCHLSGAVFLSRACVRTRVITLGPLSRNS